MRHSNTYWALNKGTPAQLDHALRINAHDYKTARDFYAKIEPTTDEQPVVTEEPVPIKAPAKSSSKKTKPAPMKATKVIQEVVVPKPKPKPAPMKAAAAVPRVIKETPIQVKASVEAPILRRSTRNK